MKRTLGVYFLPVNTCSIYLKFLFFFMIQIVSEPFSLLRLVSVSFTYAGLKFHGQALPTSTAKAIRLSQITDSQSMNGL